MPKGDEGSPGNEPQFDPSRRKLIGAAGSLGLAAVALTGTARRAEAQSVEGCLFALEIHDFLTGFFQEVSGLGSETQVTEALRTSRPGNLKWNDITLKRGITSSMDLAQWRKLVEEGQIDQARKSGSIVLYDESRSEVARWNFTQGWPKKIDAGGTSSGPACAMETITLTVEHFERVR